MGIPGRALSAIRAVATLLITTWLVLAMAMPVLAGKQTCSLQATVGGGSATEVEVGEEVLIEGFGFPALLDVEIAYSVDGAPVSTVTVTTDAAGIFETTVTPAAGQEGLWSVAATDIEDICTAETGFLVVAVPVCSLDIEPGFEDETGAWIEGSILVGSDFPPGDVEITYSVNGSVVDTETETVTADASGSFQTERINPPFEGRWTITATDAEGTCSAQVEFFIVASGGATPSPVASQLPNAAIDNRTDTPADLLAIVFGAFALGCAGWIASRRGVARRLR